MTALPSAASRLICLVLSVVTLSCPRGLRPPSAPPLTRLRQLKEFSVSAQHRDQPLEIRGVVTFFDASAGVLYLRDDSAALALDVGRLEAPVTTGDQVLLTASVQRGSNWPRLQHVRLEV